VPVSAHASGIPVLCGTSTLSGASRALALGAFALKFFPTSAVSPDYIRAVRPKLDPAIPVFIAGGVTAKSMMEYGYAGASHFCVGFDCGALSPNQIARDWAALERHAHHLSSLHEIP